MATGLAGSGAAAPEAEQFKPKYVVRFTKLGLFMFFCDIALSSKISLVQYMVSTNTLLLNFQICVGLNQIF